MLVRAGYTFGSSAKQREMICGDSRKIGNFGSGLSLWFFGSGPFGYCIKDDDDEDDDVLLV